MKKSSSIIILLLSISIMFSCSSTEEATTTANRPTTMQMQQWEEQQERQQEGAERSGLSQEDIQVLNNYADRSAELECKLRELDKAASEALSPSAESEIKESVVAIDNELTKLNQEVDEFCINNDRKTRYYHMISKKYLKRCP